MIQPTANPPAEMVSWLESLMEAARQERVVSTSAGAGPNRDYAYLHYRTADEQHSVLVFRPTEASDDPAISALRFDGDADEVAERVAKAVA